MGKSKGKGRCYAGCLLVVQGDLGSGRGGRRGGDGAGLRGDVGEDGLEHVQVGDLGALDKKALEHDRERA